MNEIHRLCGFDKVIGSEKDPKFIRKFWKGLWNIIGTTLSMNSRYHPQTNDRTKIFN